MLFLFVIMRGVEPAQFVSSSYSLMSMCSCLDCFSNFNVRIRMPLCTRIP